MFANFASDPQKSKDRLHPEKMGLIFLSPFELDKTRIIDSTAFRRLEHKTQVFVSNEGDHYRNRLTHSLEAAQITRIISQKLNITADLAEAITLAHDIGHAPFGHAGEDALKQALKPYNLDFDHNLHALKLFTKLENKYPGFEGLNLSWEFIEGIAKHNGPVLNPSKDMLFYVNLYKLDLNKYASLEAQVSAISDDIAYNSHDIDDGFRAGLLTIDELSQVSIFGDYIRQVDIEYPKLAEHKLVHEAMQRMKNAMILDVIATTEANIQHFKIQSIEDIRNLQQPLAQFSNEMELYHREIKVFLMQTVYKHKMVQEMTNRAASIIKDLFQAYMDNPEQLPISWKQNLSLRSREEVAIIVCDFIACMSDRYAISQHDVILDKVL